jgi:hypothetical protein
MSNENYKASISLNIENEQEFLRELDKLALEFLKLQKVEVEIPPDDMARVKKQLKALSDYAKTVSFGKKYAAEFDHIEKNLARMPVAIERAVAPTQAVAEGMEQVGIEAQRAGMTVDQLYSKIAKGEIKTTLAQQNVIRIIQDAPYGMMGIANNIEQLAESFGRLKAQTGSLGHAFRATFGGLLTGPMAIPLIISAITALILSKDKLGRAIKNVWEMLKGLSAAQREYNKLVRELRQNEPDKIFEGLSLGQTNAVILTIDEQIEAFKRLEAAQDDVMAFQRGDVLGAGDRARRMQALGLADERGRPMYEEINKYMAALDAKINAERDAYNTNLLYASAGSRRKATLEHEERILNSIVTITGTKEAIARDIFRIETSLNNARVAGNQTEVDRLSILLEQRKVDLEILDVRERIKDLTESITIDGDTEGSRARMATLKAEEAMLLSKRRAVGLSKNDKADPFYLRELELAAMRDGHAKRMGAIALQRDKELHEISENKILTAEEKVAAERFVHERVQMEVQRLNEETITELREAARRRARAEFDARTEAAEHAFRESQNRHSMADEMSMMGIARTAIFARRRLEIEQQEERVNREIDHEMRMLQIRIDSNQYTLDEMVRMNDRMRTLEMERTLTAMQAAENRKEVAASEVDMIIGANQQLASTLGGIFNNISAMIDDSSEKGFRAKQQHLYASAVMDAISAGIGIYRSYMSSPLPPPMNKIMAVAEAAAVTTQLMARAKQIAQMKPKSASTSGGWTTSNSSISGDRVFDYERNRMQRGNAQQSESAQQMAALNGGFEKLAQSISDIRVTIDEPTSAAVVRAGQKRVSKLGG